MKKFFKLLSVFLGVAVLLFGFLALMLYRAPIVAWARFAWITKDLPLAKSYSEIQKTPPVENIEAPAAEKQVAPPKPAAPPEKPSASTTTIRQESSDTVARPSLPAEFNLAVPFTSQAPDADWSMPFKEACEEASVAMVDAFYTGRTFTPASATLEILENVSWEKKILFHWEDTDASATARILREKYGYQNTRVAYDMTLDDIKREIAAGHPVIVPAAGRLLGNRYFTPPGPVYHMLVVRGWTRDGKIITNDPGTKHGENFLYDAAVFMDALHDLNGGDVINGRPAMIVAMP